MNDNEGKIWYGLGIDNTGLGRDAAKSSAILNGIGSQAESQFARMDKRVNMLGVSLATAFGGASMLAFGRSLIDITGKFQTFEAVLTNTLNSPEKAKSSMLMLQEFAATTPFQVDGLTGAFVKLANQGFVPTMEQMRKLGDLASSTGKGFDQLAEAIIDAQVGEFERLKEFGIRASKEGDKVTFTFKEQATQVDFTASAIRDYMLSLGDLQGVQGANAAIAKTLTGQMSNLEDVITQTMNEIGQSSEGVLSGAISGAAYLVENYEEIGRVLGVLIGTYGLYRAALIAVAAYQKAMALVQTIQQFNQMTSALRRTTQAQILLNKAVGANPYVKLASILMTVGGLIWAFAKNSEDAADSQETLNSAATDAAASLGKEQVELDLMFERLKKAKKGTEEYNSARNAIQSKYGSYLSNMSEEIRSLNDIAGAYAAISEKAIQAAKDRAVSDITSSKAADYATSEMGVANDIKALLSKTTVPENNVAEITAIIMGKFREGQSLAEKDKLTIEKLLRDVFKNQAAYGAGSVTAGGTEVYDFYIGSKLEGLQNQKDALSTEIADINKIMTAGLNTGGGSPEEPEVKNKSYWEAIKKEAQESREALEVTKANAAQIAEYRRIEAEAQANIDAYDTKKIGGGNAGSNSDEELIKNSIAWYEKEIQVLSERNKQLTDAGEIAENNKKIEGYRGNIAELDGSAKKDSDAKEAQARADELDSYQRYAEQLVEIERWKEEQINSIKKDETLTDTEKESKIKDTNSVAEFDKEQIAAELGITSDAVVNAMMQAVSGSIDLSIQQIISNFGILEQNLASITGLTDANQEKRAKILAQMAKLKGELNNKLNDTDDDSEKGAENIAKKYARAERTLKNVTDTVSNLQGAFGDMLGEAAHDAMNTVNAVSSSVIGIIGIIQTTAWTGAEAVKGVEKASVILMIISMAIQALMAIVNVFKKYFSEEAKLNASIEENKKAIQGLAIEYDNLREAMENSIGRDWFKKSSQGIDKLDEQIRKTQENINSAQAKADSRWNTSKGRENKEKDLEEKAEYEQELADLEKQRASDLKEWYQSLMTTDIQSFSADLATQLIDGWRSGLEDMGSVWDDAMDDLMAEMLTKQLDMELQKIMQGTFNKIKGSFNEATGDTELSQAELDAIKAQYDTDKAKAEKMSEEYRKMLEEMGLIDETEEDSERKASQGAMGAAASQESMDVYTGIITNVQGHTYNISEKANVAVDYMQRAQVANEQILSRLSGIETNTAHCARLEQIENDMGLMRTGIEDIRDRGITIKR